jgi:hypothetical protein
MILSSLFSLATILVIVLISFIFNEFMDLIISNFSDYFIFSNSLFLSADQHALIGFCQPAIDSLLSIQKYMNVFQLLLFINTVGYFTSAVQKATIISMKDNIDISVVRVLIDVMVVVSSVYTLLCLLSRPQNPLIAERCSEVMTINARDKEVVGFMYGILS